MSYGVIVQSKVAALNIDSKNRAAVSASDYENGSVGYFSAKSATTGEAEVWTMTAPVTGSLTNLWMAYEPEVVTTISGSSKYKGLDPDPRNYISKAGDIFSVFQPMVGDLILMSVDAVTGTKSTNTYVVATNAAQKLTWAASAVTGLSLHLVDGSSYMSIGTGAIDNQRVTAYLFEVVVVA